MKNSVFGQAYASYYDLLYADKHYERECDLIEEAFNRYSSFKVRKLLDLGCGTGNHAWSLARRGYQVIGVDLSEPMLQLAQNKKKSVVLPPGNLPPLFLRANARELSLRLQADGVIAMFAVLGYQAEEVEIMAFLKSVARHLKKDGLFLADFWYGPAVEAIRPEPRKKVVSLDQGKLIREAAAELVAAKHYCLVHYRLSIVTPAEGARWEASETHRMRFFFEEELKSWLPEAGLEFVSLSAFGDLDLRADSTTWNAFLIAKKD